jgi:hypothetical protein
MSCGHNAIQWRHGLDENADRRMRRLRAQVDTGDREPAKLPVQEMPLDSLGQGRRGRQDARSQNQDGSQSQDHDDEEPLTPSGQEEFLSE